MRKHRIVLWALTACASASPILAQVHQHAPAAAQQPGMAAMHCGAGMAAMMHGASSGRRTMPGLLADSSMRAMMMEMMGPPTPAMLLQHKQQLDLTADQVSRLEALQKEAEPACTQHMRLGMTAHHEANQLLDAAAPDFTAYANKLKKATAHMVAGHVVMAKAGVAARGVLSDAQKQSWKSLMGQMHKR